MGRKKSKGKSTRVKSTAKKSNGESKSNKKQIDIAKVRESINHMVGASAKKIASKVIENAKITGPGQLASAKYLFEAVGLYPPTEETAGEPKPDSLAMTLLRRMGLPTEPVIRDEDDEPITPVFADDDAEESLKSESGEGNDSTSEEKAESTDTVE